MDPSEFVKEWKYRVSGWLLGGIEPGFPQWEFDITTTILPIIDVLEIIAMSYLVIGSENAVKLELQS